MLVVSINLTIRIKEITLLKFWHNMGSSSAFQVDVSNIILTLWGKIIHIQQLKRSKNLCARQPALFEKRGGSSGWRKLENVKTAQSKAADGRP